MKLFPHNSENGFSLIEVLIALVILVIVILGGGLYFFYGHLGINREGYRRAALVVTSQTLEKLKAANYGDIAPEDGDISGSGDIFDPSIRYYLVDGSSWSWIQPVSGDPPEAAIETIAVGNPSGEENGMMVTEAQWVNDDGDSSYDYLKITVTVKWNIAEWGDNSTNKVELATLIAP